MALFSRPIPAVAGRTIVTEEALRVSPEILGLPLASPWRRGVAIAIDGLLIVVLASAPSVLFGLAMAIVLWRASRQRAGAGRARRWFRFALRLVGAAVLFAVAVGLWRTISRRVGGEGERSALITASIGEEGADSLTFTGMAAVRMATLAVAVTRADDAGEAREAGDEFLKGLREAGMDAAAAGSALRKVAEGVRDRPWVASGVGQALAAAAAADSTLRAAMASPPIAADSIVRAYAAALTAQDTATLDSLRPALVAGVAIDTIRALDGRVAALTDQRAELRERIEALEEDRDEGPGIMAFLRSIVDDLGLGLGWSGLYFTATTALWRGKTPGKRLLRIRVIRLTGRPIGWWASFERFGGYAAGVATGLLGFLQIFWDDNRQATHDKIASTAVVRD